MTVTVRFAPSPTGLLHVGNARVALINWLFAKRHGGYVLLRIDDTDAERSRDEYVEAIREDLRWLGLQWDRRIHQSQRLARYAEAADRLRADGRLYPCYETPEELDAKRKRQLARGRPPVYDRAARRLTDADRRKLEADGRRPHWRFLLEHEDVRWEDAVRGTCHYHGTHLSDPVLIRADGTPLYTLPSVVDDADLHVSHVIRGEDHVTNTAAQIQLFRALGAEPPVFAHLPLLTDESGHGLSKRLGSLSLRDLRAQGIEPLALDSLLAKLGTSDPIEVRLSLDELVDEFDLDKLGRATPRFDPADLDHLNARLLHALPYEEVAPRLAGLGIAGEGAAAFWAAVRGNLNRLSEAAEWWRICTGAIAPAVEDADFTAAAASHLPPEPWGEGTYGTWIDAVKAATGRKGKTLFHPLRLALTGRGDGPELKLLLPVIGKARAVARLHGQTA